MTSSQDTYARVTQTCLQSRTAVLGAAKQFVLFPAPQQCFDALLVGQEAAVNACDTSAVAVSERKHVAGGSATMPAGLLLRSLGRQLGLQSSDM